MINRICRALLICLGAALPSIAQAASCGDWRGIDRSAKFAKEKFGTFAIQGSEQYFVFEPGTCVEIRGSSKPLTFVVNHNGASVEQPTFLSAHVALISFGRGLGSQYLYRSVGQWNRDKSGIEYSSNHSSAQEAFNDDLKGDQSAFDAKYTSEGRFWNDSVDTTGATPFRQNSWAQKSTFAVRDELINAVRSGAINVKAQNYLISFRSRITADDVGRPPNFEVDASGYDCVYVRVSGSSGFGAINSQYLVTFSKRRGCGEILGDLNSFGYSFFSSIGLWSR